MDELSGLTPDEKIHLENELLKIKLQTEFGMQDMNSGLDRDSENEWLNYIHNFEKQYADRKRCKVYDFIGRPEFRKAEELDSIEISIELIRIKDIMHSNGIELGMICDYDDRTIYCFITEELFETETDDVRIEGMMHCFTYEEFHPNHDYDIRGQTDEFITFLISKKWDKYLDGILLATIVTYNGKQYDPKTFPPIIHAFQDENQEMELIMWDVTSVKFDLKTEEASLDALIKYRSINANQIFEGLAHLDFIFEYALWTITKIILPGFSEPFNAK